MLAVDAQPVDEKFKFRRRHSPVGLSESSVKVSDASTTTRFHHTLPPHLLSTHLAPNPPSMHLWPISGIPKEDVQPHREKEGSDYKHNEKRLIYRLEVRHLVN